MKFYLPDFGPHTGINLYIIDLLREHPEYFYDGVEIGAIYGAFPPAIWNSGRLISGGASKESMAQTIYEFNSRGIPIRYTYTNSLIEEKHLYDSYCNLTMDLANNGMNEVLVNSPLLEHYLRMNYPNFKYILSTTRCERDISKINQATNHYDLVVIDYRDNCNMPFLHDLENKDKIEILINAYCDPNCPMRKKHYETIAKHQLNYEGMDQEQDRPILECPTYGRNFYDILSLPTVLTSKDIYTTYTSMGFKNFKIEGRTLPVPMVVESYMYYLIKPMYRDKVRLEMLTHFYD